MDKKLCGSFLTHNVDLVYDAVKSVRF